MIVHLIEYTPNPAQNIEDSAAICYSSTPSNCGKIMDTCYDSGHQSVLEHSTFTFHISGVSRALLAQLSRHRLLSMSVRSQRYCVEDDAQWVVPHSIAKNPDALLLFQDLHEIVGAGYDALLHFGVPAEDARYVLANATETTLNLTLNLRSLIHIANERLCNRAQWEIRELVAEMCRLVGNIEPKFKRYLVPKCESHKQLAFCTEKKSCGKHQTLKGLLDAGK